MELLKGKRSYIKGQITRIENFVKTIKDDTSYDELSVRLDKINQLHKDFVDVEYQMMEIAEVMQTDIEAIDIQYYSIVPKLQGAMRKRNTLNPSPINLDQTLNTTKSTPSEFRLPRTNIPSFDGNFKEWFSFYDLYVTTVHENSTLSPAQKFQYLKGLLKGEALALIQHFPLNDASYIEAYQQLCKRYDKKRYIVDSFIETYFEQPIITQATSESVARLHDTCDQVVRGLKALGPQAESRDPWLIFIATQKMDKETKQMWKLESSEMEYPTFEKLLAVLNKRMDTLRGVKPEPTKRVPPKQHQQSSKSMHTATAVTCAFCKKNHNFIECTEFKFLDIHQRRDYVRKHNRCFNCLSDTHVVYRCKSRRKCSQCQRKHHDILHLEVPVKVLESTTCSHSTSATNAVLPTAQIQVERYSGEWERCRALLDSGSQTSFVTEECFQRLGLKKANGRFLIQGLNDATSGVSKGVSNIRIKPRFNESRYEITAKVLIVPSITSYQPSLNSTNALKVLDKLRLADPEFSSKGKIDILLGSDLFFEVISTGKRLIPNSKLIAHNSRFGWVVAGTPIQNEGGNVERVPINLHLDVDSTLRKFWDIEEIAEPNPYNEEEQLCMQHYKETVRRAADGRYVVSLPFKNELITLTNSKQIAVKRQFNLEKRLARDELFKDRYYAFMNEYIQLGHMTLSEDAGSGQYYLPHHGVLKETSTTTKLRVVFDGSAKATNGNSLNNQLLAGPIVQSSLVEIILRFRTHRIVFAADIEKMFRQIWINPKDSEYQKIVWRKDPRDDLQTYKLLTVTYGTTSAPFLATQTLNQLAEDYQTEHPEAASVLKSDFYVDDVMSGANNLEKAQHIVKELDSLLKKGGFHLRKWSSNSEQLLCNISEADRELAHKELENHDSQTISILGVKFVPQQDVFQFKVKLESTVATKRQLLSEASKIFDPMGWLSPAIVRVKILFQKLWLLGIDWDEQLPSIVGEQYEGIRRNLHKLEEIQVSRWLYTEGQELELHGFADASELAYAAVIYSRMKTKMGYKINIVAAKTKVAPIKSLSIPRLELCAAVLLTKLMASTVNTLKKETPTYRLWTDSTIVLNWLSSCPRKWKTFVCNRVSYILEHTNRKQWGHVSSIYNPADCASRGLFAEELVDHQLWWSGPQWLKDPELTWQNQNTMNCDMAEEALKEQKPNSVVLLNMQNKEDWLSKLIERCSTFSKLLLVIVKILLMFRRRSAVRKNEKHESSRLSIEANLDARNLVLKRIQQCSFASEINDLTSNKPINKNSKLISLFPFIDKLGLLRVGGRLNKADVSFDMKHPIILPARHHVTTMIIRDEHINQLHAGSKVLMARLKENYYILRCKEAVRSVISRCVKCIRLKAQQQQQLMGQLPQARVTYYRPFFNSGVDYAGPLLIKASRLRGATIIKAYLALFVCLTTKAVHLELVCDMTTEAFLAALRRFHGRRGIGGHIYSDNGTNFVGAARELRSSLQLVSNDPAISNYCSTSNIEWHFIPPGAPNFGGLWEAAIKSTKYYLKRVVGETRLTFEEMTTLLIQIEAILNSRPLCEMSVNELDPLTPGHFLIGHSLTLIPEPNLLDVRENRLSRWQHIQRMVQHFWQRWHKEYLLNLQQRHKWQAASANPAVGELVVINEPDVPPTKWLMGRITKTIPGQDGLVRVVGIKTKHGEIVRPISKICKLLSDSDESMGAECSGSHTLENK